MFDKTINAIRDYFTKGEKVQSPKEPSKPKGKYDDCEFKFFPITGRYYPMYNKHYIFYWSRGEYTLETTSLGCIYGVTKEDAKNKLDRFLEVEHDFGVKILKVE